jgi:hypothetical protein
MKLVKALYNHLALPYFLKESDRSFYITPVGWYNTIELCKSFRKYQILKKPRHFYKFKKLPWMKTSGLKETTCPEKRGCMVALIYTNFVLHCVIVRIIRK